VVLFLLSAWPDPRVPDWLEVGDRLAHAGLYAVLGVGLGYGRVRAAGPPPHLVLILVGALYGATDEWHQAFVRGRSPDWVDWLADVTGVLLGYLFVLWLIGWLADSTPTDREVDGA
jgi:VanZ family protein